VRSDDFEWDDRKAARNRREHGVSFETAREAFRDGFSVDWIDPGQDPREERISMLAMVGDHLLFVAYMLRGETIRIISARRAEPHERRRYHNQDRET
jgi:uncharacterized DUF497 family protein